MIVGYLLIFQIFYKFFVLLRLFLGAVNQGDFTRLDKPFTGGNMHLINTFFHNLVPDITGAFYIKPALIKTAATIPGAVETCG